MVDASSIVIAVWDGSTGGTANCIGYARRCNKHIIYINPKQLEAVPNSISINASKKPSQDSLPMGYHIIGKHEVDKLMKLKEKIIERRICAVDYETDSDIDDDTIDTQDHNLTMVSVACEVGQAFCIALSMDAYGANFELPWFITNFLKPILEHPDVLIVIHNVKAEHGWSLLYSIDMFDKACKGMVIDTMLLVKAVALPENTVPKG
jgi:hypothetical protein